MTLRARSVIGPVRSGSPDAVPVYRASVIESDLPSVVVHVRVETFAEVAENVPATLFAVLAPPIPSATATLGRRERGEAGDGKKQPAHLSPPWFVGRPEHPAEAWEFRMNGVKRM